MEKLVEWIKENIYLIVVSIICLGTLIISSYCYYLFKNEDNKLEELISNQDVSVLDEVEEEESVEAEDNSICRVDIKGAVKNPGVYECNNSIVSDIITLAGGLTKSASTENINLSKKVTDEMVIVISTKSELKKLNESKNEDTISSTTSVIQNDASIDNDNTVTNTSSDNVTTSSNNEQTDTKININTADVNLLTTLSGIGESKAQSIIDYRNTNGNFKTIEDLLNVSGIGEALFAKVKDYITV